MKIVIGSQATIFGITRDMRQLICRKNAEEGELPALRIKNPKYEEAMKFNSCVYNRPKQWLDGYTEDNIHKTFTVPRAWMMRALTYLNITQDIEYRITDDTDVTFPDMVLTPLQHQDDAMDELFTLVNTNDKGNKPTDSLIVMNTSAGKTILGMMIAANVGQRTLVVVPTKEIEAGWVGDAVQLFGVKKEEIGQIRGKNITIGKHITIGSVQTLMKIDPKLWADKFGMLVLDECHSISGDCFSTVMKESKAAVRVGLTATDNRKDGAMPVIRWHLGNNCYKDMTPRNCTELTYVCVNYDTELPKLPVKIVPDVKRMKTRESAYKRKYIEREMRDRGVTSEDKNGLKQINKDFKGAYKGSDLPDILRRLKESPYQKHVRELTDNTDYNDMIIALVDTIRNNYSGDILISSSVLSHIDTLVDRISSELNIPVAKLVGTQVKGREALYAEIKRGKYKVTVGTQRIVSTGASNPKWAHVIVATPFSNEELAVQLKGRPIRLDKEDPSKTMGYVWDIVATTSKMSKNMARTRFKAIEPYTNAVEVIQHTELKDSTNA